MAGPKFTAYMKPVLEALEGLGGSGRPAEVTRKVAELVGISPEEQSITTKNGNSRFVNQVGWARFYLAKAGLIDSSTRGVWSLTEEGRTRVGMSDSDVTELFRAVHGGFPRILAGDVAPEQVDDSDLEPPPEPDPFGVVIGSGVRQDLLQKLGQLTASGFERFCQRLLRESGFQDVQVTGQSNDKGIDGYGTLEVGPFVSVTVLFQCKRYSGSVTPSQVRDFRGRCRAVPTEASSSRRERSQPKLKMKLRGRASR